MPEVLDWDTGEGADLLGSREPRMEIMDNQLSNKNTADDTEVRFTPV